MSPINSRLRRNCLPGRVAHHMLLLAVVLPAVSHGQDDRIQKLIADVKAGPRVYLTSEARAFASTRPVAPSYFLEAWSEQRDAAVRQLLALDALADMGGAAMPAVDAVLDQFPKAVHVLTLSETYEKGAGTFEDWLQTKIMGERNKFILTPPFLGFETMSRCEQYIETTSEHVRSGDLVTLYVTVTFHAGACALARMTGQVNFGYDHAQWRQWRMNMGGGAVPAGAAAAPPPAESWTGTTRSADVVLGGKYRFRLTTGDEFTGVVEAKDDTSIIVETDRGTAYTFRTALARDVELLSLPSAKPALSASGISESEIVAYDDLVRRGAAGLPLEVRIKSGSVFTGTLVGIDAEMLRINVDGSTIPVARGVVGQITTVPAVAKQPVTPPQPQGPAPASGPFDTVIVQNPETDDYGRRGPDLVFVGRIDKDNADQIVFVKTDRTQMTIRRGQIVQIRRHTVDPFQDPIKRYAQSLICPSDMALVDVPPGKEGRPFFKVCVDRYEFPNAKDATPAANVAFADAKQRCESAGKRLCSADEWRFACGGLEEYAYPYGWTFEKEFCNSGGQRIEPSAGRHRCVSKFGLYDMTGNVFEWVAGAGGDPALMGGPMSKCQSVSPGAGGDAKPNTGARCCKSN